MSFFTTLKQTIIGSWIKQFLSVDNLTQQSTWKGIVGGIAGALALKWAPEVQDQVVAAIVQAIGAAMATIAAVNVVRNEKK